MNHSRFVLVAALLLGAITQLNCAGCGRAGPPSPEKGPNPPPSVEGVAEAKPRPVVSLALRGSTEPKLEVGAPWLLLARVLHPAALGEESTTPFAISGEGAFALELRDAAGAPVAAHFERVGAALPGPVALEANSELELSWRLSGAESAKLAAGAYSLTLSLALDGAKVHSSPVQVTLMEAAGNEGASAKIVAADDAMARGDFAAAEAEVDAVLATQPDHVQALSRKAELRERAGDLGAAYEGFNSAINAALAAEPGAPEGGPRHLYFRRAELAERLDGGSY